MTTLLIGLSGYSRSGKDSAAQVLVDGGWRRDAFADRLRTFLLNLNPLVPAHYDTPPYRLSNLVHAHGWDRAKELFPEIRSLLQRTGTEAGRAVLGEDIWVDALFRAFRPEAEALVISDVRFPNEARRVKAAGGVVIRIRRPGVGPLKTRDGAVHQSEIALDDWPFDAEVVNDGSLDDLRDKLLRVALLANTKLHTTQAGV
ncbi:hypothetical protein AB0D08_00595 [Kitasatospora sp. NPDC048540]|uniref:deoxynucleotide monophosphate kinase family protein n=1 Tax=Kitasatospora sp. NPDC048540 TaxID=3155634 RepID=UPI0033F5AA63